MSLAFTHDHYRDILRAALDAGYRFAGFEELEALKAGAEPACLLRHDCDNDLVAASEIAEIEADMGVRSTWFVMPRSAMYNMLAPPNRALVEKILVRGHGLGLHFDASLYREKSLEALRDEVQRERSLIEQEFGSAVNAMSFHQPDERILRGIPDLGILNTYDRKKFDGVFYYSDSNLNFREGCPSEIFRARRHRLIQLLLHPEWWTATAMSVEQKWARMLANNIALAQQSLLSREKTYAYAHRVQID